jgi:hypothetical protein
MKKQPTSASTSGQKPDQLPTQWQSHAEIIRRCFINHPNQPLTVLYLYDISGSLAVHSRISDLRLLGYNIVNRRKRIARNGVLVTVSSYVYMPDANQSSLTLEGKL